MLTGILRAGNIEFQVAEDPGPPAGICRPGLDIEADRGGRGRFSRHFSSSLSSSFGSHIMSSVFVVCLCSLMVIRMAPGSRSHVELFHAGKSSVSLVDLAVRGIFFRLIGRHPAFSP
jgi:hypothetical protein